jgi:hypothetical protein
MFNQRNNLGRRGNTINAIPGAFSTTFASFSPVYSGRRA